MTKKASNRGNRLIARQTDEAMAESGANARTHREAEKEQRTTLLARIRELETTLRKSERAREGLRHALTAERVARQAEREDAQKSYLFAVRTLAKRANLDGNGVLQ